jgi:hypothetical protein
MRNVTAVLGLFVIVSVSLAQGRVPQEQAERVARQLVEQTKLDDAQVKVEPDAEKPCAIRSGEHAALVMPDKRLTEEALAKAGKDVLPVGQFWLRQLAPKVDGKPVPNDKLRILKITIGNDNEPLSLCLIGARKNAKGELELVLYGKEKEPLVNLPLKKVDSRQEMPIELQPMEVDEGTASLQINILGKYEAKLTVGKAQ